MNSVAVGRVGKNPSIAPPAFMALMICAELFDAFKCPTEAKLEFVADKSGTEIWQLEQTPAPPANGVV